MTLVFSLRLQKNLRELPTCTNVLIFSVKLAPSEETNSILEGRPELSRFVYLSHRRVSGPMADPVLISGVRRGQSEEAKFLF